MIELLQVLTEIVVVVLAAVGPLFQQVHGDVDIAPERVHVVAAQEQAIEHCRFTPGRERIGEVPVAGEDGGRYC